MAEVEGGAAHRLLGLTDDELAMIEEALGRSPSDVELAMYSVMWSEHCSYKSSRVHLGRLPSAGPRVVVGPGENAGVVDVGDGIAIAMRIESHNHPSAVEPYQGAATGVGGILRDVFTMGARPIALMDALFTGPLDDASSRYLLDGIVRGVSGYGNSVGVPTVGGSLTFDRCYAGNPLVNVFCLGVLPLERLVLARASGDGNLAVLLGSATGRDGIGGVSVLASAGFTTGKGAAEAGVAKRPSVQVGDPYEEKRLIDACLELLSSHLVVAIQDLGGAGLACATSELAARGGVGMDVDVSAVPRREQHMTPAEVMTSESQERMLAIVMPEHLSRVEELCGRFEVSATVIGTIRTGNPSELDEEGQSGASGRSGASVRSHGVGASPGQGRLRVYASPAGEVLADLPAASLAEDAPRYHRPLARAARTRSATVTPCSQVGRESGGVDLGARHGIDLLEMLSDASFVYQQYDHQLLLNTVLGPGEADAAVLKLAAPGIPWRHKALALSVDANPGWCALDPRLGAAATVAESALNVACAGATPVALVDCLNFGNPEHPEVMWQLSEAIDGIAQACLALDLPVVGGNVSLYNESEGLDIDPTPVVAVVGLVERLARRPPAITLCPAETLVLLGRTDPVLAGSRWAAAHAPGLAGPLPALDLELHRSLVDLVAELVAAEVAPGAAPGLVTGVHDVSSGGLGATLGELVARSGVGCQVVGISTVGELFSESSSRVVVCTPGPGEVIAQASARGIDAQVIGLVGGVRLGVGGLIDLAVSDVVGAYSARIARALETAARPS